MTDHRLADKEIEEGLERSRQSLLAGSGAPGLIEALRERIPTMSDNVYVFTWIPEQGEDLYDVLLDGMTVAHVEVPRPGLPGQVVVDVMSLSRYRYLHRAQTKMVRRKLEAAIRLARSR